MDFPIFNEERLFVNGIRAKIPKFISENLVDAGESCGQSLSCNLKHAMRLSILYPSNKSEIPNGRFTGMLMNVVGRGRLVIFDLNGKIAASIPINKIEMEELKGYNVGAKVEQKILKALKLPLDRRIYADSREIRLN